MIRAVKPLVGGFSEISQKKSRINSGIGLKKGLIRWWLHLTSPHLAGSGVRFGVWGWGGVVTPRVWVWGVLPVGGQRGAPHTPAGTVPHGCPTLLVGGGVGWSWGGRVWGSEFPPDAPARLVGFGVLTQPGGRTFIYGGWLVNPRVGVRTPPPRGAGSRLVNPGVVSEPPPPGGLV